MSRRDEERHHYNWDLTQQENQSSDPFLDEDDSEEFHDGESLSDLSNDPMLGEDKPKSRRLRRQEKKEHQEELRVESERERLREELLEELREKGIIGKDGVLQSELEGLKRLEAQEAKENLRSTKQDSALSFRKIISGEILSQKQAKSARIYMIFIALLSVLYITNIFSMHKLHRKHENLTFQVKELRAKSLTLTSERMEKSRQSNIMEEIERRRLPLHESLAPNEVIRE